MSWNGLALAHYGGVLLEQDCPNRPSWRLVHNPNNMGKGFTTTYYTVAILMFDLYVMVFKWHFLPHFSPLTRHNGQVLWSLRDLLWAGARTYHLHIILQNPQHHSAKSTWPLCKFTWLLCKFTWPLWKSMKTIMQWSLPSTGHYVQFNAHLMIWARPNSSQATSLTAIAWYSPLLGRYQNHWFQFWLVKTKSKPGLIFRIGIFFLEEPESDLQFHFDVWNWDWDLFNLSF
jgi:hypothetical protein